MGVPHVRIAVGDAKHGAVHTTLSSPIPWLSSPFDSLPGDSEMDPRYCLWAACLQRCWGQLNAV